MTLRLLAASTLVLALAACSPDTPEPAADETSPQTANDAADAAARDDVDEMTEEAAAEDVSEDTTDDADTDTDGLPAMDIHVAGLSWVDGIPSIGTPRNVTNHPGYDNQPAFVPGTRDFYYSAETEAGTTDVFRHNAADGSVTQITNTPGDGEYSPRLLADGQSVAFLHQNSAGTQLITRSDLDGGNRTVMLDLHPVGYFAFNAEGTRVAMFVLTEPFTLQVADLTTGDIQIVHEDIGPALYATTDGSGAIFTTPRDDGGAQARLYDFDSGEVEYLFDLPGQSQNYGLATAPDGLAGAFSSDDGMLLYRDANSADWTPVADLASFGLDGVTRIAVSDDGQVIAIVAAD
tara:strand:- start:918 stop:1961 length:1044 start_codon:yes stop_codon:yes gene_type:complete